MDISAYKLIELEDGQEDSQDNLLVTLDDDVTVHDPRIIPIALSSFLWSR